MSDTPDIDKKIEENTNTTSTTPNWIGFVTKVTKVCFLILVYIVISVLFLYNCKIAQCNILPTDENCKPYTDNPIKIEQIFTNIFIQNTNPPQSEKMAFSYEENSSNILIDMIRKMKNNPTVSWGIMFLLELFQSFFTLNYSALNLFFHLLNQLPEILILLLGPLLYLFFLTVCGVNYIRTFFTSLKWFFKKNVNTDSSENAKAKWEDITMLEPINYGIAIFLTVIMVVFFIVSLLFIPLFSPLQIGILGYCFFSMATFTNTLNGQRGDFSTFLIHAMKHFKITLSVLFSLVLLSTSFSYLGSLYGIVCIAIIVLIYCNIIPFNLYKTNPHTPNITNVLSKLVPSTQAKKTCVSKNIHVKKGWFFGGQNITGGGLTKILKNL
jgi:hypothetical protein